MDARGRVEHVVKSIVDDFDYDENNSYRAAVKAVKY